MQLVYGRERYDRYGRKLAAVYDGDIEFGDPTDLITSRVAPGYDVDFTALC